MKKKTAYQDHRVKRKVFPLSTFISVYVIFAILATMHMQILARYIDYKSIPSSNAAAIFVLWIVVAASFTLVMNYHIRKRYQEPVEKVSEAARTVAQGDFSVSLAPYHKAEESTQIDVLISDFNQMVRELNSTEILKSDFISNVSHEFKAPLAVIKSNAEMMADAGLPERQQLYMENIVTATDRLSALITNLLRLNKLENQSVQPVKKNYDLCLQLEECAIQFEAAWEAKDIEFNADLNGKCLIEADEELLSLVWMNLLSNAIKFTPDGGKVTLKLDKTEDGTVVTISDTGCGMDENTKAHMFDKFYQGDTSHATEGNGLGLTLVRRILQMVGGKLEVESAPGNGSTFIVSIPMMFLSQ